MTKKVKEVYCFKNIIKTPDGTKLDATYNAVASHIRNQKMAEFADALFAFWVDGSSGTKDMILRAQKEKLEINTVLL